jgi:hypothetical protein
MNKLTRNILAFLVTFLAVQVCAMYIMGGFHHQTVGSKFISISVGAVIGMAVLAFTNETE